MNIANHVFDDVAIEIEVGDGFDDGIVLHIQSEYIVVFFPMRCKRFECYSYSRQNTMWERKVIR